MCVVVCAGVCRGVCHGVYMYVHMCNVAYEYALFLAEWQNAFTALSQAQLNAMTKDVSASGS